MPTSEEYVHGVNKEKSKRGSPKISQEPEELANVPVNHKPYFEVSITQRGKVVVGGSSLSPWKMFNDLNNSHYKIHF